MKNKNKEVIFLFGLIGSGKTTFAINNFEYFTDLDFISGFSTKKDQIDWTKRLLKITDTVCHITTIPTEEELNSFRKYNKRFILIDTSLNQCKTNILIRNRKRDMENIHSVLLANEEYAKQYKQLSLEFERIAVF